MTASVRVLTGDDIDEAIAAPGVLLVDFWADWCAPCHRMHPVLQELAADYAGRVTVASVEVQQHPLVGERFGVTSLPTLIFFRDGEQASRLSGVKRRPQLERELDTLLG